MEFKVRGNVVLFDALEVKKASNLIVSNDNKEYKLVVAYVGDVEGINVGDEIVLRNDKAKEPVALGEHFYWLTQPMNVLAVVKDNPIDTYTYEETISRQKESPIITEGKGLVLPHIQDLIS